MLNLARMMARDGEGATKLVECSVSGAKDELTAETIAKSVITSSLFKSMIFGEDANAGRIYCAIGYADADVDISKVDFDIASKGGRIALGRKGCVEKFSEEEAKKVLSEEEINHLAEYEALIEAIEVPAENVLDAVKLSAMAGEKEAQKRLVEYSLRKVVDIARLYAGQGVYMEDLIGAGNERLLTAVTQLAPLEKPDEVDGYLGRRIMDAMEDLVAINLDEKAAEKAVEERVNLVADRARELAEELGRKVSVAELAREYDMDPEDIQEAVRLSGNAIGDIG
jgi:hypothetical protein